MKVEQVNRELVAAVPVLEEPEAASRQRECTSTSIKLPSYPLTRANFRKNVSKLRSYLGAAGLPASPARMALAGTSRARSAPSISRIPALAAKARAVAVTSALAM